MPKQRPDVDRKVRLGCAAAGGVVLLAALLIGFNYAPPAARADPIEPPLGYPKFLLSTKTVTPSLAHTGGVTLYYTIDIVNTGAYTGFDTVLVDWIPDHTTYNDDLQSSVPATVTVYGDRLIWIGDVGFDSTAVVSFSVTVLPAFSGTVRNTAVITHPNIHELITMTAETVVTDAPILTLEKSILPSVPGPNGPITYTITVANWGQSAVNLPITLTDHIPFNTTLDDPGSGTSNGGAVTWTDNITLELGQSIDYVFSVIVGDVPSGTVIANDNYYLDSAVTGVTYGEPHTVTVVGPIFDLSKSIWPDPPGSNRAATYTLSLVNLGSLATGLVITDRIPAGVTYLGGGSHVDGVVSWTLGHLDTGDIAEFTYTIYISDVLDIPIVNNDYWACSSELGGICMPGRPLTSVVQGPIFEVWANVEPLAKKTGGEPMTPTLGLRNIGNGNAIAAMAHLTFSRMSLNNNNIWAFLPDGSTEALHKYNCTTAHSCRAFDWVGNVFHGEVVTFAQDPVISISSIGGAEGEIYRAAIVVTDSLSGAVTPPASAMDWGKITHFASVIPIKTAVRVIGPGQILTYTINVINSGFSTDPPIPVLTDVVPLSTTFLWASHGGISMTISNTVFVSWTLEAMGPGDSLMRQFSVYVPDDLVSGTQIINDNYSVLRYSNPSSDTNPYGPPVTTTVQEVGLIHSFKVVTPTLARPGVGTVLTYYLHIVNSSGLSLTGVTVHDLLPWEDTTYQRDAIASSGDIVSDIVSIDWTGDVDAYSTEVVTLTVVVDPGFQGMITNTATISHATLANEVIIQAEAHITEEPILTIVKSTSPRTAERGGELEYRIIIFNSGQEATGLIITDTLPINATYIAGSANAGGLLVGDTVRWEIPRLLTGGRREFTFRVFVQSGNEVINDRYAVICAEGVRAIGQPVVTEVSGGGIFLPLFLRNAQ